MTRLAAALALAVLVLSSGSACINPFERKPPEKQRFMFRPAEPPAQPTRVPGLLRIARVRVSPVFDNKGFVYRTGENKFETDFYNEFFSPPGVLLREALQQWLASASLFAAVDRGSLPDPDWLLETQVDQLYADRRKAAAPQAVLVLGFRLLDARTGKPSFERHYTTSEAATDASPAALVEAWDRALAGLLGQLCGDLRSSLPPAAPGAAAR